MNEVIADVVLWLVQGTIAFSLLAVVLLAGHRKLLAWFGPRSVYPLWLLLPFGLVLPPLAQVISPVITAWMGPAQLDAWQSWTTLPTATLSTLQNTSAINPWILVIGVAWLLPAAAMTTLFAGQYWRLRKQPIAYYKGLYVQWQPPGTSPGIAGLTAPRLQLPGNFTSAFNRNERHLIIQHELTHWRRRDLQMNAFAWLLLACQWFNPLAWQAYRRFRADQELACDASVLATHCTTRPQDMITKQVCYAKALLAAMQSVSLNAHSRNLWSAAACTHYGIAQGERAMAQERFNQLNQHHQSRRWPALLGASMVTLAGLAWFGPVTAVTDELTGADFEAAPAAQPIVRIEPRYPAHAVEEGTEGYVDLSFVINEEGRVANIQVIHFEPTDVFSAQAVSALERWRYAPENDLPQKIRLQFALQQD